MYSLSSFASVLASSYLLFPFSYSPQTAIITLHPPPHLSSCRPLLLPSILQILVGSRTISRGSWWPAAPSLWSLPAIVPGPTAAWLLHSITRAHTGLIPAVLNLALASIMGETLGTWIHASKQDTWGKFVIEEMNNSSWPTCHIRITASPYVQIIKTNHINILTGTVKPLIQF